MDAWNEPALRRPKDRIWTETMPGKLTILQGKISSDFKTIGFYLFSHLKQSLPDVTSLFKLSSCSDMEQEKEQA